MSEPKTYATFVDHATNREMRGWGYVPLQILPRQGDVIKLGDTSYRIYSIDHAIVKVLRVDHQIIIRVYPYDYWIDYQNP